MSGRSISVLETELYDVTVAAAVLHVPESTLRWWLEGGVRGDRQYPPVLRPAPTGSAMMRWGEVVEAGYLAGYRRGLRVKLWMLRDFISLLRDELEVPYPLATARPWVGPGRKLLVQIGQQTQLDPQLRPALVEPTTGQGVLLGIAERFLDRVEFEPAGPEGEAARIRPLGHRSPIVIDPAVRFGMPSVHGISTSVLADKISAGELVEAVAGDYDLAVADVVAALSYERTEWPLLLTAA